MLEKIGLPAKPSLRGRAWVVDASHCQGCSSQFTFINRKHHCRRCGGIFCNTCTQQRMVLRGQGDSPVRICEPCKTLEEAARFEARYGHKHRSGRGSSRSTAKHEDEVMNQALGKSNSEMGSTSLRLNSTSLSSNETADEGEETQKSSVHEPNHVQDEIESASPEKLRQQALDEKKKYKILKGEGKPDEALKAFKRGKELERQADALELSIRKNRKKILLSGNTAETHNNINPQDSIRKRDPVSQSSKDKDDLLSELKDLGWTDTDLHDGDKKPVAMTIEGELSSLLREVSQKPNKDVGTSGIDKTQVFAHKRKALELKRAGNLAEAKEELKKAKILEKELEEQELLGGAEDSDDELTALIRGMDEDKEDDFGNHSGFDHLLGTVGDLDDDRTLEVTDDDLMDPEMAAALRSLGWDEESESQQSDLVKSVPVERESLLSEIQSLKREAVNEKKAGNVAEAMALLKKAKLLEREMESPDTNSVSRNIPLKRESTLAPKSRLTIQKELLALKKKALTLRREGKLDEAEEELRKGKVLEQQLEELDNPSKGKGTEVNVHLVEPEVEADVTDEDLNDPAYLSVLNNLGWKEDDEPASTLSRPSKEDDKASVTRASSSLGTSKRSKGELQRELLGLKRKALALRREGKIDEAEEVLESAKVLETQMEEMDSSQVKLQVKSNTSKDDNVMIEDKMDDLGGKTLSASKEDDNDSSWANMPRIIPRSKGEIQRELLGLKRKSLALRRQGKTDEAEEVLRSAKVLEAQLELLEEPEKVIQNEEVELETNEGNPLKTTAVSTPQLKTGNVMDLLTGDDQNNLQIPAESDIKLGDESVSRPPEKDIKPQAFRTSLTQTRISVESQAKSGDESVSISPEKDIKPQTFRTSPTQTRISAESEAKPGDESVSISPEKDKKPQTFRTSPTQTQNPLQQEVLARKRKAVALKREGKLAEAREELRQAKLLEKSLESAPTNVSSSSSSPSSSSISNSVSPEKQPSRPNSGPKPSTGRDRFKLQQESLSHKRQALKLRREGRMEEAEAEFELAKNLELQLEESTAQDSTTTSGPDDDLGVEDFLDPQLLSALKSLGIDDGSAGVKTAERPAPAKVNSAKGENVMQERAQLEEQIKAEKVKALTLKRSGKQAEALEALRRAKLYEKKLNSLASA